MSENLDKNEELKKYEKLAEENRSLDKFRGSDIIKWAVKLKHDERTAKKYEGVSTVQEILKKAREDGFNFTEKELLDFNLDLVAGGLDVNLNADVDAHHDEQNEHTHHNENTTEASMNASIEGSHNNLPWQTNNSVTQQ